MRYKYKSRPLRILKDNQEKPYIKYKSKNISLKGYNIQEIIKIIAKLSKKIKKPKLEDVEKMKKKTAINSYLAGQLTAKMSGSSLPPKIVESSLKEDTEKINKLNEEVNKYKKMMLAIENKQDKQDEILKAIENSKKDINKDLLLIENKQDEIKNIGDNIKDFINFDNGYYSLILDNLVLKGKTPEEIKKQLYNYLNKLDNDMNELKHKTVLLEEINKKLKKNVDNLENEKKELNNNLKLFDSEKNKLENEKRGLEEINKNLMIKQKENEKEKEKEIINKQKDLTEKKLNEEYKKLKLEEIINKMKNEKLINDEEYNNLIEQSKQKLGEQLTKKNLIKITLDKKYPEEQEGEGFKRGGLWTNEINKILSYTKYYIGTFANNEIDKIIKIIYDNKILKGGFIINTNDNNDKSPGHWCAVYYDISPNGEQVFEWFDPFGFDIKNKSIIPKFEKLFNDLNIDTLVKVKINKIKQQSLTSSNCGWFSIRFLLYRFNNINFKEATQYKKIKENENEINEMKKNYNKYGFI
jgi:hypothetical protein